MSQNRDDMVALRKSLFERLERMRGVGDYSAGAADIRFVGQGFEIVTPLPGGPFDDATIAQIRTAFIGVYRRIFAHVPPVDEVELINLRVAATETLTERPVRFDRSGQQAWKVGADNRDVWDAASGRWRRLTGA